MKSSNLWMTACLRVALVVCVIGFGAAARAADETARFNGTWKGNINYNGQLVVIISIHEGNSYKNYVLLPTSRVPAGEGKFAAADGKWSVTAATTGDDSGTYTFTDDDTAVCKNAAGVTVMWQRYKLPLPPIVNAPAPANPAPAVKPPAAPPKPAGPSPQVRADIQAKIAAHDDEGALAALNQQGAASSPDPFLCISHAQLMLKMENYRQARAEMTFFLQHTFDNTDAYVVHAQASAAMGDLRWADQDLVLAAQLRPETADADRKSIAPFAALEPKGFVATELPAKLDDLVKMAAAKQPLDALARQAMQIVKGEWNIRKVEADEYRERKRQLVAAVAADPYRAKPLVDLATFLYDQASYIHGDAREGVGVVAYRLPEPDAERQHAISAAQAALKIDPRNAQAMAVMAGAMIALGDEANARPLVNQALSINPNEPELLRMLSQLATRSASRSSDLGDQMSMPAVWEDDQYRYIQTRSEHDLELARRYNAAAEQENATAANALQAAGSNTQGTAAGFYYQAIQALRKQDTAAGAAAMEQAVKRAPDNVEYRDYLSYFYGKMGWRKETEFFRQRSIADNMGETTASKMLRLAYKQLRRQEYADARLAITEAMRIDPADPRGPAYMGLLIAGESRESKAAEAASWLQAACALEDANLRLWGVRRLTPNMQYTPDQIGLESGLVVETGRRLIALGRSPEALQLARQALADVNRVEKARWPYRVPTAMLPLVSLQSTPAPHMDPVKAAPIQNTTSWAADLHELAGNALKALGQSAESAQELRSAENLRRPMQNPAGNRPGTLRR